MSDKKRKDLSLNEKFVLLEKYETLPKMSQREAAVRLQISQPLLCRILKNRESIKNAVDRNDNLSCKRSRSGKDRKVESALKSWFSNMCEKGVRINGPMMRRKAEELAKQMGKNEFVATEGWFRRWKKRENVDYKSTQLEIEDIEFETAEWPEVIFDVSDGNSTDGMEHIECEDRFKTERPPSNAKTRQAIDLRR